MLGRGCLVLIDVLIRDIRSLEWHRDLLKKYLQKQIELLDRLSYLRVFRLHSFMVSYHGGGFHENLETVWWSFIVPEEKP